MTMRLILKCEGNQPGDAVMLRNAKKVGTSDGNMPFLRMTDDLNDVVVIGKGESVELDVPAGHFDPFRRVLVKGQHG